MQGEGPPGALQHPLQALSELRRQLQVRIALVWLGGGVGLGTGCVGLCGAGFSCASWRLRLMLVMFGKATVHVCSVVAMAVLQCLGWQTLTCQEKDGGRGIQHLKLLAAGYMRFCLGLKLAFCSF